MRYDSRMGMLERKIPPLLLTVVAFGAVLAVRWLFPRLSVVFPGQVFASAALAGVGMVFLFGAAWQFRRSRTTFNPVTPERATALVSTGIYAYTRNPMYLGMALLLSAAVVCFGSFPGMLVVAGFCAYLTRFQIEPEERAMLGLFGARYQDYMARVRRWI